MSDARALTLLRSRGRRLCKVIAAGGEIHGYADAKTFDLTERTFSDLAALHGLLCELSERRDCCVVRGGIADRGRTRGVRRLLHADGDDLATLIDVPRAWLALDIDGAEIPDYISGCSAFEMAMFALTALGAPFISAGCVAQATASAGLKTGARCRVWLTLARPINGSEAAIWVSRLRRTLPAIDPASARPAQIVYTGAPIFENPEANPVKDRVVHLAGAPVRVPPPEALRPPPPPPPRPLPEIGNHVGANYARAALTNAAARIMGAGEGNRHRTILAEARSLRRLVDAGAVSEVHARGVIETAARHAGKSDDREIFGLWAWAAAHPSEGKAHV